MERGRSRPEKRKCGELKQGSGREAERQRRVDRVAGEGWGEGGRGGGGGDKSTQKAIVRFGI